MQMQGCTLDEAFQEVVQKRQTIQPNPFFMMQLKAWEVMQMPEKLPDNYMQLVQAQAEPHVTGWNAIDAAKSREQREKQGCT